MNTPKGLAKLLKSLAAVGSALPDDEQIGRMSRDQLADIMVKHSREKTRLKEQMTKPQIDLARKFCSDLRREIDTLKSQLSAARQLCHHESDQGCDCEHCGDHSSED